MALKKLLAGLALCASISAVNAHEDGSTQFATVEPTEQAVIAAQQTELFFQEQPIAAIDMHLHTGSFSTMGPLGQAFLIKTLNLPLPKWLVKILLNIVSKFQLDPYGKYIGIKTECHRAGMKACVLFSVYAPETWGITSNEFIVSKLNDARNLNQDKSAPYFFGFASVNQTDWEQQETVQLDALRQALSHPDMLGIKLAFIHNSIPLDDRRFDSIYQVAADMNVPVYHHLGSSPLRDLDSFATDAERQTYLKSYDPAYLEAAIADHPNTRFILGHMGFDFNNEGTDYVSAVFDLASRYPNVYLEISAFGRSAYDPEGAVMDAILREARERDLLDRVLYGSDGPGNPGATKEYAQRTLASMARVGLSRDEAENILAKNLIRLTRLKNQPVFQTILNQ